MDYATCQPLMRELAILDRCGGLTLLDLTPTDSFARIENPPVHHIT